MRRKEFASHLGILHGDSAAVLQFCPSNSSRAGFPMCEESHGNDSAHKLSRWPEGGGLFVGSHNHLKVRLEKPG